METSKIALRVALLVGAALALAAAAAALLEKKQLALATVDDIERQLAALDPVTRAAVLALLSKNAARG